MTGMMRWLAMVAAALLLAGCGGSDGSTSEDKAAAEPSPASAEPTPVESDECRSTMDQADSIATELETASIEDGADFSQYEDRLGALYKTAAQTCGPRVSVDFGEGMTSLARVTARYQACSFSDPMFKCDVAEDLIAGTALIHKAATTALATA